MNSRATSSLARHQIIERRVVQSAEEGVGATIALWEQMATQIISIIGEGGFDSLYTRSIFLARSTLPWLAASPLLLQARDRFAELKTSLDGKTSALIADANTLLLVTFTDILASLIGENLTISILRSAWGINPTDAAGEETR